MVTIHLYNSNNEPQAVNKTLGEPVASVTGYLLNTDVTNPVVKLQAVAGRFNYAYIPELNRYYFVVGAVVDDNNFLTVKFMVDVLFTYAEQIKAATATATSTETANYLNTAQQVYDQRMNVVQVDFSKEFESEGKIIMVTIKGN